VDGYDPVYGARPLKRLMEREIQNPLARRMLEGGVGAGDTVAIDFDGSAYTFEPRATAQST